MTRTGPYMESAFTWSRSIPDGERKLGKVRLGFVGCVQVTIPDRDDLVVDAESRPSHLNLLPNSAGADKEGSRTVFLLLDKLPIH